MKIRTNGFSILHGALIAGIDTMTTDNNKICPVCNETYNHYIDNGYRNGWPTEDEENIATIKFEVCTPNDSDYMYVHTEGVRQMMSGDGLSEIQNQDKNE